MVIRVPPPPSMCLDVDKEILLICKLFVLILGKLAFGALTFVPCVILALGSNRAASADLTRQKPLAVNAGVKFNVLEILFTFECKLP